MSLFRLVNYITNVTDIYSHYYHDTVENWYFFKLYFSAFKRSV